MIDPTLAAKIASIANDPSATDNEKLLAQAIASLVQLSTQSFANTNWTVKQIVKLADKGGVTLDPTL